MILNLVSRKFSYLFCDIIKKYCFLEKNSSIVSLIQEKQVFPVEDAFSDVSAL